ncbi:MAG: RsmD family RNA methyltransferase [Cytophagales bacterium]|nr:RsmD family RNA methyltransferase [Cytophagales bacterium]MDW8385313.1 rRNA adenine N-6-methyltransferase family protein [Flammeovirgaceae bacterium]
MNISPKTEDFIQYHLQQNTPICELLLRKSCFPEIDVPFAVQQIEGRKRAKEKLPTFFQTSQIVYPPKLALEQCSSEKTAFLKANLLEKGNILIDLTGGFGVDSYAFAHRFKKVIYLEKKAELAHIAENNFQKLGAHNVCVINQDCEKWLSNTPNLEVDVVYIDPSRRNALFQKIISLQDCEPNVIRLLPQLQKISKRILLKASPMFDIQKGLQELPNVEQVSVVSVENECKELLFLTNNRKDSHSVVVNVFVYQNQQWDSFSACWDHIHQAFSQMNLSMPQRYLYEPDAAYIKTRTYALRYQATHALLHLNSVLLTNSVLDTTFIGRKFEIQKIMTLRQLQQEKIPKANITTRNFPMNVAQIRAKTQIAEGGDIYLFATTLLDEQKVFLMCQKV